MSLPHFLLSKSITAKVNRVMELFLPPILFDQKIVACFFNYLQGRGFRYYDVTKDPAAYPRGKRDSDCTPDQQKAVLELIKGRKIIDVGCGNGTFIESLSSKGYQCLGVDPNCKEYSKDNLQLLRGLVQDFKFPARSFDTLLSFKTLEHIPHAESELAYWRTLADKRIILVLPCQRYRKYVYDGHINFYPDEYQLRMQLGISKDAVVKKINGEWLVYEDIEQG